MPHKTDSTLTGAAGEHLVLSRLLQRGIMATPAPRGTAKVDIVVNFAERRPPVLLQVKARQYGSDGGWHMSQKHENLAEDDVFYCLVDFEPDTPKVFVIPSPVVARAVASDYQLWLKTPGRGGVSHKPTAFRRIKPSMQAMPHQWMDEYYEAWDQFL